MIFFFRSFPENLRSSRKISNFVCNQKTRNMKKAVIYSRVSSIGDRQSTERQVVDLKALSVEKNLELIKVFEEHISGAMKTQDRPVLTECLDFCFSNGIDILLISELSRLGRNVDDVIANVRLCKERHLNVYFQKEQLSIFSEDGKEHPFLTIMIAVLGTCAEMERENIKFRLNSGRAAYIARNGHKGLGRPKGTGKTHEQLADEYKSVIKELKRGTSVRRTAKLCDVSSFTVQKVKKEFAL